MPIDVPAKQTETAARPRVAQPPLFRVLMHNDDYTTMEFVVRILRTVFHKSAVEAEQIMLTVHHKGVGQCGTYPFAVAETKVQKVHAMALEEGFPLRCSLEPA